MTSRKIGYLVSHNYDDILRRAKIFRDEHAMVSSHFQALGYTCEKVDWQNPTGDWSEYACLIPKAVWNYFDLSQEFVKFLKSLQSAEIPMQNPIDAILWNMDKRYLLDYVAKKMPTIPTVIYPAGSTPEASWFDFLGSDTVLVKPAVSGGSKNTVRFSFADWRSYLETFDSILQEGSLLVQPYIKEVEDGEYSFFFFNGKFSHAILKKPKGGDFRAHSFFGAELLPYAPTVREINESLKFLTVSPKPCAYARVDLVRIAGVFYLVELEIIEPYLYMEYASTNPARDFAAAIVDSLAET